MEHISHEGDDEGAWVCICGNTPHTDGFDTCNAEGEAMEPDIGSGGMTFTSAIAAVELSIRKTSRSWDAKQCRAPTLADRHVLATKTPEMPDLEPFPEVLRLLIPRPFQILLQNQVFSGLPAKVGLREKIAKN